MSKPTIHTKPLEEELEDRKRLIAYQIWESEGRPEGKAEEHWERACLVVMSIDEDADVAQPEWLQRDEDSEASQASRGQASAATGKRAA